MKNLCSLLLICLSLFLSVLPKSNAQCITALDSCNNTFCNFDAPTLNNTLWTTTGFTAHVLPNFCGTIETNQFYPFISDGTAFSITAQSMNCTHGDGIQLALYDSDCQTILACYEGAGGGAPVPIVITDSTLIENNRYFIMVDGFGGDQCDYTFSVFGVKTDWSNIRLIQAKAYIDNNGNCLLDSLDVPASELAIKKLSPFPAVHSLDSNGKTKFFHPLDELVQLCLDTNLIDTALWIACQDTISFLPDFSGIHDTVTACFLLQPKLLCADLHIDLAIGTLFRQIGVNTASIKVTNLGTISADSTVVKLIFPAPITVTSSHTFTQIGDTLCFNVGALHPFKSETITFSYQFNNNPTPLTIGSTVCLEASASTITPNCYGSTTNTPIINLTSECTGDSTAVFTLKNVGTAPTSPNFEYIIIEDEVVLRENPFNLNVGESMQIMEMSAGETWRVEADRNGLGGKIAAFVEGCGGLTPNIATSFWLNTGSSDSDIECRTVVGSYDPNQKTAMPRGVGVDYAIPKNIPIEYTIDFQNTGTDTAFTVRLEDILPSSVLNIGSFRAGASSHSNTWEIRGDTLAVLFENILLPDSNVNQVGSQGFFSFRINQNQDLPDGTYIENTAAIYFDFNAPIVTDAAWHTVNPYVKVVLSNKDIYSAYDWRVLGNPAHTSCTFISEKTDVGQKQFALFDAQGKMLQQQQFSGQRLDFEAYSLPTGLYFFKITSAAGVESAGRLLIE